MRYYQRDESGTLTIRSGDWHVENGVAYRIDPDHGIDWSVARRRVGDADLYGWPDTRVAVYEGGVLLPEEG